MTAEAMQKLIADLGRWFEPTAARYRLQVANCMALDCPELIESFVKIAQEVINTPEAARDSLLAIEPCAPYEPHTVYRQYSAPIITELFGGTPPGKSGKQRKKKKGRAGK